MTVEADGQSAFDRFRSPFRSTMTSRDGSIAREKGGVANGVPELPPVARCLMDKWSRRIQMQGGPERIGQRGTYTLYR